MNTLKKLNKNLTEKELSRIEAHLIYAESGCWLWQGYQDKDGYCQALFRGKMSRAHRVVWYALNGLIEDGLFIDHICRVTNCVNPQHLRKVTPLQNTIENSKSIQAFNAKKTHCKNGHFFDRKYLTKKGGNRYQRYCSVCQAAKTKRLRQKDLPAITLVEV